MQTTKGAARPGAERKRPERKPTKQAKPKKAGPQTAQQTIPYREIFKDGKVSLQGTTRRPRNGLLTTNKG